MRKSAAVPLVVTSSLALALSGCSTGNGSGTADGADDAEYQGVCVDQATQTRVSDDECDDDDGRGGAGSGGGFWYYGARGARIPPIGSAMPRAGSGSSSGSGSSTGGSGSPYAGFDRTVPTGSTFVSGGAPADGGTVSPESLRTAASSSSSRVLSATESGSTVRGGLGGGSKAGS